MVLVGYLTPKHMKSHDIAQNHVQTIYRDHQNSDIGTRITTGLAIRVDSQTSLR